MAFLGRLLPFQVKVDAHKTVEYRSVEEVKRDIVRMRLPLRRIIPLLLDIGAADQPAIAKMLKNANND